MSDWGTLGFGTALGTLLGWLLGQGGEVIRLKREERRAIGRALKTLLVVRDYLESLKMTQDLIRKQINPPPQQVIQYQAVAHKLTLPSAEVLFGKYEEAIDVVSGVKPLLGVRLVKETMRLPLLMRYADIAKNFEEVSTFWLDVEKHISDPSKLDKLILELAELHGIETRDDVQSYLSEPVKLPPGVEESIKRSLIPPKAENN